MSSGVGAVVIGRNEGERLRACLESILAHFDECVYVDSGSTDGSMDLAVSLGAHTVGLILGPGLPYTAARARNVGWKWLIEQNSGSEYVQFVDGDCCLASSWASHALAALDAHPEVAIVTGHVRELLPKRNIYHRLAAMEWDTPVGVAKYCGGIAMYRVAALKEIDGFRDGLAAGEEPELCVRLRQAGWTILKLDEEMAVHDIAADAFPAWWRRTVRSGRAYTEGAALHGAPPERHWVRETRSILIWGIAIPTLAVLFAWPSGGLSLLFAVALYLMLTAKIVLHRLVRQRSSFADAVLYAMSCVGGKLPQAIGMLQYYFGRRTELRGQVVDFVYQPPNEKALSKDLPLTTH